MQQRFITFVATWLRLGMQEDFKHTRFCQLMAKVGHSQVPK